VQHVEVRSPGAGVKILIILSMKRLAFLTRITTIYA
jgi:hypothetical protein